MSRARIHIPSPCTADWGAMRGDAQRRFCDLCNKHVHNLSAMTEAETAQVIAQPSACVRATLTADGEVLRAKRRAPLARLMMLSASLLGVTDALAAPQAQIPEAESEQSAPVEWPWMEWIRSQIRATIEQPEQGQVVMGGPAPEMGKVVQPPPPPPPPPVRMGRIARPPILELPVPPVQPVGLPTQIPEPAPGESVIPEVEEALRGQ